MRQLLFIAVLVLITSPTAAQVALGTSTSATNPQRSGDATTGLFSPASGTVSISNAGTEMMRVNGTGVGIGIAPTQLLTVYSADNTTAPQFQIGQHAAIAYNFGVTVTVGDLSLGIDVGQ
jgi:hypothetical protein